MQDRFRDNHTKRNKGIIDESYAELQYTRNIETLDECYIERTTLLDDYDIAKCIGSGYYNHPVTLNKHNLWDVVGILDQNCISKSTYKYYSEFPDKKCTEYTLPVTGERLIKYDRTEKKKYKKQKNSYLLFDDKKYNCKHLYKSSSPYEFSKYTKPTYVDVPDMYQLYGRFKICGVDLAGCDIATTGNEITYSTADYRPLNKFDGYVKHIIIDFTRDTKITHISTMGRRHSKYYFPTHEERKKFNLPVSTPTINYITEWEKHYVTEYSVYYRKHSSKNWISLGIFTGNQDRLTEVLHAFDEPITARFIKIIPLQYCGSPSMQIRFFGPLETKKVEETTNDTTTYRIILPSKMRYTNNTRDYVKLKARLPRKMSRIHFRHLVNNCNDYID